MTLNFVICWLICLIQALRCNSSLKVLTLRSNKINVALEEMGLALEANSSLEQLSLFGNDFDETSGRVFFSLISRRLRYIGFALDVDVYEVDGKYMIAEVN